MGAVEDAHALRRNLIEKIEKERESRVFAFVLSDRKPRASLAAGDVSEAIFGGGLQQPMTAEIHLVVRTHGPAVPGKVDSMLYEIDGGCEGAFPNPPCSDVQFAIFKPPAN